ncbi:MAG: hypothetical protein B7Z55_16205 [Planctomycetales bacterium 12-60-4]|nr:MAG: hypothetical protein B7Z55_16205 [Planctomycetales bacterium 12-60-4]
MKTCVVWICLTALACAKPVDSAEQSSAAGHQTRGIEGWTLVISDELLENDKAATERALELLTLQLQEIVRVVPAKAVVELRKVPLWFSPEYPGVQPRAEYHPGAGWLRENKRDPAMAKAVEFTDIRDFERETKRMPIPKGFGNEDITAAFENAKPTSLR